MDCLALKVSFLLFLFSLHGVAAAWTTRTAPSLQGTRRTKLRRMKSYSPPKPNNFSSRRQLQWLAASKIRESKNNDAAETLDDDDDDNDDKAVLTSSLLRERAQKARKEADSLEQDLVQSKLRTLEDLLLRQQKSKNLSVADRKDIQDRIDQLKNYIAIKSSSSSPVVDRKNEKGSKVAAAAAATSENAVATTEPKEDDPVADYVFNNKEGTPEDQQLLEELQSIAVELKELLNETMVFSEDDEMWKLLALIETDLENSLLAGNITQQDLKMFKQGANLISSLLNWAGFGDWDVLKGDVTEELVDIQKELKNDPYYLERIDLLTLTIPTKILDSKEKLNETAMETFVKEVMVPISDAFSLESNKAKRVGPAYLIRGTSKLKSGDDLIDKIDKQLVTTGLQNKYQYYYIRDQTVLADLDEAKIGEEVAKSLEEEQLDETILSILSPGRPALLVTSPGTDLSPELRPEYRGVLSILTVAATAFFANSCYAQDTSRITSPIFFGILGIQLLHEMGHFVAASLNKFDIAFPFTMLPSPNTGLLHTNTHIKSPPRNNNAMFDFALSGPLMGLAASWITTLVGLSLTARVPTSQVGLLPHVPLNFFQLSTLTSATIESFLGTDVLLSLDPISDNVAVHPLVIAGHVCILINALNILPSMKTSDGGRMLAACFTRYNPLAQTIQFCCYLFLLVQGIRGWNSSNLLILYLFLVPWIQHSVDVPCRNNVDRATGIRPVVFSFISLLAVIALSPSF